jgi:hypothetical protein
MLYAPGTWLYFYARREQQQRVFTVAETAIFGVVSIAAILALAALVSGAIVILVIPGATDLPPWRLFAAQQQEPARAHRQGGTGDAAVLGQDRNMADLQRMQRYALLL